MRKLILFGAGGYSDNIRDIVKGKFDVVGYLDTYKVGEYHGLPILGKTIEDVKDKDSYCYFVSIGDVEPRKRAFESIRAKGLEVINVIDETAYIAESCLMGKGNYIAPHAAICSCVELGDNNYIGTAAVIEHGGHVGNHTRITTNATVNGEVIVGDEAYIGSGSVLIGLFSVGKGSVIGAGSVVLHEVEPYTTVVGVPARFLRKNK